MKILRPLSLIFALLFLLSCTVLLGSCQQDPPLPQESEAEETSETTMTNTEEEQTVTEGTKKPDIYVEMITYNIAYYDADSTSMEIHHENQSASDYTVELRAQRLDALVKELAPDILALQEVNSTWWPYLISGENSIVNTYGYGWSGNLSTTGEKDGGGKKINDLYNLLLWNKEKFEEIESGVFRLAPKQGNDTNKNRLCAYAILKNRETGTETLYASCHFCTRPDAEMRELSLTQAKTLTSTLTSLAKGRTIVVGGDFNAKMDTPTYKHITETAEFFDTRETAYKKTNLDLNSARIWGKVQTWFDGKETPIDHIFYLGNTIVADEWQVLTDTYTMQGNVTFDRDKIGINYDLSDHMAIYVKFRDLPE